ncbi:MAG TPA: hypothetical protein VH478_14490 [Trebonia sp.]|jgi:hypothetical protein|nr:hypothetical protein [Trebonia sp.]
MGVILHLFVNVLIVVGTIVPFLAAAMLIVYRTTGLQERLIRGLALFTATLVVLGSQAAGLTVGKGIVDMMEVKGFGGLVIKLAWILLAGSAGAMLARYLTNHLYSSTSLQLRVMVFVGMVVHLELLEIYVSSFSRNGFAVGAGAIPDIAFISGLLLYIVLRYDPEAMRKIRGGLPHRDLPARPTSAQNSHLQVPLIPEEEYIDLFGEES